MSLKKEKPDYHETDTYISNLKIEPDEGTWLELSEEAITQITLFNRRQVGEMERITRKNNRSGTANADGQYNHMSPLELELLKTMSKMETQDKQGRKVAVFFY